ncbi:hypothetical protein [Verminephrobacter eiseniae]|uniref:hypothetical protein n=1 Tax=Verminephrobacter eiseniae TaxID=364317 RepID=UPI0022373C9F|nr:hypothetical protein [Verminephrobacter eiseniae]
MIVPLVPVLETLDDSLVEAGYDPGGKSSQWFTERIHTPFITASTGHQARPSASCCWPPPAWQYGWG